jgi:hypothetical protein
MFEATLAFLDTNNALWSGTAAFADAVNRARSGVTAIDTAASTQQTPTTGVTTDKAQARADLEDKTLEIADQVAALAVKNKDNDLAAQVDVTKSSLDRMVDSDLESTAERVGNLASANLAALAPYGVTAADVTTLTALRTAYQNIKTSPREVAAARAAQTASLPQLIANARSIFRNEIDKMVTRFRKTNPDFYNGYFAARVIVNRAASHATPKAATPAPVNP